MTFFAIRFLNANNQKRNELIEALPFKTGFVVLAASREEKDFILSPAVDVPKSEQELTGFLDSFLGKENYKLVNIRKVLDFEKSPF